MTDVPAGKMLCQLCNGSGEYQEAHLVGDGQFNVETRIETEIVECQWDDGLVADPEADRKP